MPFPKKTVFHSVDMCSNTIQYFVKKWILSIKAVHLYISLSMWKLLLYCYSFSFHQNIKKKKKQISRNGGISIKIWYLKGRRGFGGGGSIIIRPSPNNLILNTPLSILPILLSSE